MKTRFFAFAALALALAACNNDNETLNTTDPVAARFTAEIAPATRVNSEGTEWTEGDRIGVTGAGFTNVPYKREYGMFVPDGTVIYFDDTETHTFHAYYPYQAEDGTVTVSTAADKQGTGIDFLFASGATGDTHNPTVSFTGDHAFKHCMSLIKFTFKPGDGIMFSETEPASYTLGGLKLEGTFDTATGTTAVTAAADSPITMQLNGATASQVIILPQGVTIPLDLSVSYNGQSYKATLKLPETPTANFYTAGYAYTYNITLNNKDIEVNEPDITPWEPGDSFNANTTL